MYVHRVSFCNWGRSMTSLCLALRQYSEDVCENKTRDLEKGAAAGKNGDPFSYQPRACFRLPFY